ncbi:UNVERIFIED_CONTAM: hypothetical protein Cloal_3672 [Acetivibrio alkalicellulosi]
MKIQISNRRKDFLRALVLIALFLLVVCLFINAMFSIV